MKTEVVDGVKNVLEVLLEHPIENVMDVSQNNEELWDSLKHLEICVTLEEEFSIKFDKTMIPNLNSGKAIIEAVEGLLQ